MEFDFANTHPAVRLYLKYIENTESPRIMHVWSFLSGISASMGRRCFLPYGPETIFPNMYVILTGPPAVRKSTAFKIMTKLLRRHTNVRFAPDDSGGQRQGLIDAMAKITDGKNEDEEKIISLLTDMGKKGVSSDGVVTLADISDTLDEVGNIRLDTRDPHTMFVAASELNSILGEGNTALLTFLQKMWDGDEYEYRLKSSSYVLKNALLGMIGATTPSQLALAMPPEAVGQGFTSRAIFVFADKKHIRKIPRPTLDLKAEQELGEIFEKVSGEFDGPFHEDKVAATHLDELYERGVVIADPRFVHYADRRHTHLQKLCMCLAASRGEQIIRDMDVNFADQLLLFTEENMADALGEYGMNKLGAAKQRLLDYLKTTTDPIPVNLLYGLLSRDMSQIDFKRTIVELHNAGKVTQVDILTLGICIVAVADTPAKKAKKSLNEIEAMMRRG